MVTTQGVDAEARLWTVRDLARFLACGERWIWTSLRRPETEKGSIPHLRLPTEHPRFDPEDIRVWMREGCPPAGAFRKRSFDAGRREVP